MAKEHPYSFSKKERLARAADFKKLASQGRKLYSPGFIVYVKENDQGYPRLGVSVSRRVGKATRRNRLKRLVREFFRLNKNQLPPSCDILVICRYDCQVDDLASVTQELGGVLLERGA